MNIQSQGNNLIVIELYSKIIESLDCAVFWLDSRGQVLQPNPYLGQLLKYSPEQAQELSIFELNPYLNRLDWNRAWKSLKKSKEETEEVQYMRQDGATVEVRQKMLFIEYQDEELILVLVDDLTDINYYQSLLSLTSEHANIGGFEINLLNSEIFLTKQFHQITGYPQEIEALNIKEFIAFFEKNINQEISQALKIQLEKLQEEGGAFMKELTVPVNEVFKDFRVQLEAIEMGGQIAKLRGTVQDITVFNAANTSFLLSQQIFDNVEDMIYWIGEDGSFLNANDYACKILRYTKEELLSMTVFDIAPSRKRVDWPKVWATIRHQRSSGYESVQRRSDGAEIPVDVKLHFVEHQGKGYICAIIRDITERKTQEEELKLALKEVKRLNNKVEAENTYLQDEIRLEYNFDNIISASPEYFKVLQQVEQVANTDATVLILGETGTGKELLARAVHRLSSRNESPLVKVNCAALPKNLIESELFGHEKGAFTGAFKRKIGRFELANKGTLFLDEIGELPIDLQSKLLRILQEGEFERVGSSYTQKVDVRVIAATNRDLPQLIEDNKFREDLYYRLNVFPIVNIPLRERRADIPLLVKYFLNKFCEKIGRKITKIPQSILDKLEQYDFPGNIRELENIIERAVILTTGESLVIEERILDNKLLDSTSKNQEIKTFEQLQKDYIIHILKLTNWQVSGEGGAAELLDLNPKTLTSKMRKLNIRRQDFLDI